MARPTKFNPQTADRILGVLRAGNTRTASALYAGVDYSTLKRWAERNAEFCAALDHAEAEAEIRCVTVLMKAVQEGDTAAAKWWLERRRQDDWRQHDKIEIDLRTYAAEIAADEGLDVDELIAEATRLTRPRHG